MDARAFAGLSDPALLQALRDENARDQRTTARLLALIGEVNAGRLHRPAGYTSMAAICVHELHMSSDVAWKRVRAAKMARRFPRTLDDIATGRLHLTAVVLLPPYLTEQTAEELLTAGVHQTKAQIEQLLAERFPRPDAPTRMYALTPIVEVSGLPRQEQVSTVQRADLVPEPVVSVGSSGTLETTEINSPAEILAAQSRESVAAVSQNATRMDPDPFSFTAAQQSKLVPQGQRGPASLALPRAQSIRSGARVRRGVHAPEARAGSGDIARRSDARPITPAST